MAKEGTFDLVTGTGGYIERKQMLSAVDSYVLSLSRPQLQLALPFMSPSELCPVRQNAPAVLVATTRHDLGVRRRTGDTSQRMFPNLSMFRSFFGTVMKHLPIN